MELPSNMLTPSIFAEKAKEELQPLGVKVNIYDSDWIKDQKMNAFWSVAKGSTEEPKMVEMIYEVKGFTGRLNGGASFRLSFDPHSAWDSIESTTILTAHPSLQVR